MVILIERSQNIVSFDNGFYADGQLLTQRKLPLPPRMRDIYKEDHFNESKQ